MAKKPSTSKTKKLPKMKAIAAKMQNKSGNIKNKIKKGAKQAKKKVTAVFNAVRINFNTTKTLQNKAKSFAAKNNLTLQSVMNNALKEYLAKSAVAKNNNNGPAKIQTNNQDQSNNE